MTPDQRDEMLIRMDEKVTSMHKELLGNGRPGRMELVEGRVAVLEDAKSRTVGWIAGACATLAAAWGALEYLFHRK